MGYLEDNYNMNKVEDILEHLSDKGMLNEKGIEYRQEVWEKYVKGKEYIDPTDALYTKIWNKLDENKQKELFYDCPNNNCKFAKFVKKIFK